MTKDQLTAKVAELEDELATAKTKLAVLDALPHSYIATSDPGSPVCIAFKDGEYGVIVYENGATLFEDTETVGGVGSIPVAVLFDELKWANR